MDFLRKCSLIRESLVLNNNCSIIILKEGVPNICQPNWNKWTENSSAVWDCEGEQTFLSSTNVNMHYGNTGCGVLKRGIQNPKDFWIKINCSWMKSLKFSNWCNGKLSKSAKIWPLKSIFYVKNHLYLSVFFIEEYEFRSTFFVIDIFWQQQFLNHFIF